MTQHRSSWARFILTMLAALDLVVWTWVLGRAHPRGAYLFAAMDVGQGDATLVVAPSGATFLTDAGPDGAAVRALDRLLPASERAIDLAVITHAQLDHYGGFLDVLRRYRVGIVLWNGRGPDEASPSWDALQKEIAARGVPLVAVGAGDRIRHGGMEITVISPDEAWRESGELNDTGIVQGVATPAWTALLAADIGTSVEEDLRRRFDLRADILKVGHHGSKYSSSVPFLDAVRPEVATVSVGARNRYGHPAPATWERLTRMAGERVFRTDRDGTVRVMGRVGDPLTVAVDRDIIPPSP